MAETKQKLRYTDLELSLIKRTFADNEDLLKAIRKVIWQAPLNALDQSVLVTNFQNNTELYNVVRKTFLPELEADAPFYQVNYQVIDLWMTVQFQDKIPEVAHLLLWARELLINYLDQQLTVLKTLNFKKRPKITFKSMMFDRDNLPGENYANMTARNLIISHTEQILFSLTAIAGQKTETPEEQKKRLEQNSAK